MKTLNRYFALIFTLLALVFSNVYAQKSTGINNTNPSQKAALHIKTDGSFKQGIIIPKLAGADTATLKSPSLTAAEKGLMFYDTTNSVYQYWNGTRFYSLGGNTSTTSNGWSLTGNAGISNANNFIGTTDLRDLIFKTGGIATSNERMRILSTGNIGIGTSTPNYPLHISNTGVPSLMIQTSGVVSALNAQISRINFADGALVNPNPQASIIAIRDAAPFGSSDLPTALSFWTVADNANSLLERVRISNSGNVGIGTATPAVSLDLSAKTDAIALPKGLNAGRPIAPSLASGMMRFNTASNAFEGYDGATWSSFQTGVSANPWTQTGTYIYPTTLTNNVGIGTATPANPLEVKGVARFFDATGIQYSVNLFSNNLSGPRIALSDGTASLNSYWEIGSYGGTNNLDIKVRDLRIYSTATPIGMSFLAANGNVGIGIALPTDNLHIYSNANPTIALEDGNNICHIQGGTDLVFYTDAKNEKMRIMETSGNVGIGTTTPNTNLTLAPTYQLGWQYSAGNTSVAHTIGRSLSAASPLEFGTTFNPGPTGPIFQFLQKNGTTNYIMSMLYNGNIGIGIAVPTVSLDLSSKTDAIALPKGIAGLRPTPATGMLRYNTTSNTFEGYTSSGWNDFQTGTSPWTISGTDIYNSNTGNVGIGTSTPAKNAGATKYLSVIASESYTNGRMAALELQGSSIATNGIIGRIDFNNVTSGPVVNNLARIEGRQANPFTQGYLSFLTNEGTLTEKMRIDNTGRVGIGTTTFYNANTLLQVGDGTQTTTLVINTLPTGAASGLTFLSGGTYAGSFGYSPVAVQDYLYMYHGGNALVAKNNKVTISHAGTNPVNNLEVVGNASIGSGYHGVAAPANGLIVQGNVGIGTPTPLFDLVINGGAGTSDFHLINNASGTSGADGFRINFSGTATNILNYETGNFNLGTGGASMITMTNAGRVGIGRTPTTYDLEVEGTASKTTVGGFVANSDSRLKREIKTVNNGLETILKLRPVSFYYNDIYKNLHPFIKNNDYEYFNFIAQEFKEVFPNSVQLDALGYYQVDIHNVTPFMVKAIQEQQNIIDSLKQNLQKQDLQLQQLKGAIEDNKKQKDELKGVKTELEQLRYDLEQLKKMSFGEAKKE